MRRPIFREALFTLDLQKRKEHNRARQCKEQPEIAHVAHEDARALQIEDTQCEGHAHKRHEQRQKSLLFKLRAHTPNDDAQNGKRHRIQEEVAAEHGLVDGDALVRRVEVSLPQERELAAEHGRLEEVCVEPERNAVEVEPSVGHVVRGEVVVRAEIER